MTPFDSFCLAAVVSELKGLVGTQVQGVWEPEPLGLVLALYRGTERRLWLTADPQFARAHLVSARPARREVGELGAQLRKRIGDARLVLVRQRGLDRVLELGFAGAEGEHMLVAELMGKHSNLMLLDSTRRVVAAAKWVGAAKSRRPVLPGQEYQPPPFPPRPSWLEARPGDVLAEFEGTSPFLAKLVESGVPLEDLQAAVRAGSFRPVLCPGFGAYPWPLVTLGFAGAPAESFGLALETAFDERVGAVRLSAARSALAGRLARTLKARESTLAQLQGAADAASRARETQVMAELVLAYQGMVQPGDTSLTAWDHEGNEVTVPLLPGKTPVENAARLFDRARRAKESAEEVRAQLERVGHDVTDLASALAELGAAGSLEDVRGLEDRARARRWTVEQGPVVAKEERPFEGHSVREVLSPGGFRVLYGTNATSNDYLTTKFARPDDWWLHVRGGASAHVVLVTGRAPEKVPAADLLFAAQVAVRQSPAKHSSYVAVDYTLRKYVRKPRGSAPGLATYTREKTLHVESER